MPGDLGLDCGRNDVTDVSDVSAMAQTTAGSPIHHHDERQSWDDHRSSVGSGPLEHARVQDRNFVRAFTSDYRVIQSPSTPGPGVFGSNPSGAPVPGRRRPHRAKHHRGDVSVTKPPHAGSEDQPAPVRSIPEASVARLAVYLRKLGELAEEGADTVSSDELAAATGVNPAKLRKDLSYIGSYGIRGVGYEVAALVHQLERTLGLNHRQAVALVGIGNLGHALAGYSGFGGRGFPVTALFDVDPDLVGIHINGILVEHVRAIPEVCARRGVTIGMIATPAQAAQSVCDLFVEAGVRCILNFAPVVLQVPDEVEVRKVDLAVELQILAFHVARKHVAAAGQPPAVNGHPVNGAGRLLS
jgi:redox-sensing transcriptional repressor